MADHHAIALSIYALGTLAAAGTGVLLWRYRERSGARALLAMMGAMVIWNGCSFLLEIVDDPTIASLVLRTIFVGTALVSAAKLVFVLEYTGREHLLRPRIIAPLIVPSFLTVFLAFANPGDLFFATLEPATGGAPPLAIEFGPAAMVPVLYAYTMNLVLTVFILGFIYRSRSVYRGQSLALLGGTMATWVANAVFVTGLVEFDVTAVGSVVSGILFAVAITRYRLLDLMPIARDRVLDTVNDAIFVVDTAGRLVDVNPEGRELLATIGSGAGVGTGTDDLVGRRFTDLIAGTELRDRYELATRDAAESRGQLSIGKRHFEIATTPIEDSRDRHVGSLLIAHDITERKRREERLEEQNERLERFASLVSHDLRNPLNVADGYLDLAYESDDDEQYLAEMERSHERMKTIIEDVLALAREGETVTDPEPVALEAVAEAAWDGVDTGSATIRIEADTSIRADPDRAQRLFENLFRNSIEHGTDGSDGAGLEIVVGTIEDDADADDGVEGFYVADDGIGIPACRRDQVLEDGYTTGEDGTGLGLSIVESIATAHGWSVRVEESESGGARFAFTGVERVADRSSGDADGPSSSAPSQASTASRTNEPSR